MLRKFVRPLFLLVGAAVSLYQMASMMDEWERRPFDWIEEVVPRHAVPFPSVTVCPEGSALWPGLERLNTEASVGWNDYPKARAAYARIQLNNIHRQIGERKRNTRRRYGYESMCDPGYRQVPELCQFVSVTASTIDRMMREEQFYNETKQLYAWLANKGSLLSLEDASKLKARSGHL